MSIDSGVFDRGCKNRGFPLTRRVAPFTTVLHYRADCDRLEKWPIPLFSSNNKPTRGKAFQQRQPGNLTMSDKGQSPQ